MSRIGNKPVALPSGVEVIVAENNLVTVKGPKGELSRTFNANMQITVEGNELTVVRPNDNKENKMLHGTTRALLNNMVVGVTDGFEKKLEVNGVGYRAQLQGKKLVMNLGYSHLVEMEPVDGVTIEVPSANEIVIKGIDNQVVGQLAAKVAEKEAQEQDLLQKKAESLDAAAESYVQKDREDVETRFRIPLFNVRLKLGSIKMSEASQNALLQEEQELLDKRREAIEAIEEKKAAWIKEQMASDISESRARMDAFQQSLTVDLVKEETGLDLTKKEQQPGQKELDTLIASMDTQIQRQDAETQKLREEIDSDILSAIKKINLTRKYTLVFRNPRANISADDITDDVEKEVQNIVE